jgi:putative glutamine amidotransferase
MKLNIGITTGLDTSACQDYGKAVERFGAVPVFLHPDTCIPQEAGSDLNDLSGLLLAGGRDIHPFNYISGAGAGSEMSLSKLDLKYNIDSDPVRDAMEMAFIKSAIGMRIPIFGICRGFQVLNVALGGGLIMNIQTEVRHTKYTQEKSAVHEVSVLKTGSLSEILRVENMEVNSRHHQGVTDAELAPTLQASAYAPDGIIEAFEGTSSENWITAVQWHPEREGDEFDHRPCRKLFEAFVSACAGC